ncbi:MAG: type II secretion system protein [Phycisphaeraceae bacterium]
MLTSPYASPSPRRRVRGFTLIELLVVVGIIALLMAILLPALGRARQEALKVQCAANLRQWGTSLHMWGSDNNNNLLAASTWSDGNTAGRNQAIMHINRRVDEWAQIHEFFDGYLEAFDAANIAERANSLQFCPTVGDQRRADPDANLGYGYLPNRPTGAGFDYTPNDGWNNKTRFDGRHSAAPIMFDLYTEENNELHEARSSHLTSSDEGILGLNFLFEDGSVSWRNPSEISVGGVHAGFLDKLFRIDVAGLVD